MRILTALTLTAILISPTVGFAMGCSKNHSQQAMSCAEGSSWDAASQSCKPQVSS